MMNQMSKCFDHTTLYKYYPTSAVHNVIIIVTGLNAFHQSNIKSGAEMNQIRESKFGVWESGFGMDFPMESCCC